MVANELLDNMAPRVLVRTDDYRSGFGELWVRGQPDDELPADEAGGAELVTTEAPANLSALARQLVGNVAVGIAVPLQLKAAAWVWRALSLLRHPRADRGASGGGRMLVIDYGCATTAELVERPMTDWLRGYRAHRHAALSVPSASAAPLSAPLTDITCDVAFDQLATHTRRLAPMTLTTQADWLAAVGLDALRAEANETWQATRAAPTAPTLGARALLDEAADLADPSGFGAFLVAEWHA